MIAPNSMLRLEWLAVKFLDDPWMLKVAGISRARSRPSACQVTRLYQTRRAEESIQLSIWFVPLRNVPGKMIKPLWPRRV